MDVLKGYRTYIVAALLALESIAEAKGWISADTGAWLRGLLGATGLATLRMAVGQPTQKR